MGMIGVEIAGGRPDFFSVPTKRFRGDRDRVPCSRAFLTDAAWRGSATLLRISATISVSTECLRGCVGIPGLVRIAQMAANSDAEDCGSAEEPQKNHRKRRGDRCQQANRPWY